MAGGTHTVLAPPRSPATIAAATWSAVAASGGRGRPAVILVVTNPGRTTSACTPEPARASPSPWQKTSRPALEAP